MHYSSKEYDRVLRMGEHYCSCATIQRLIYNRESVRPMSDTVALVIFACLNFREFVFLGLFTKSRIRESSISMMGSAQNNNFRDILKFANLSFTRNSRKLKPREYYQISSISPASGTSLRIIKENRIRWSYFPQEPPPPSPREYMCRNPACV